MPIENSARSLEPSHHHNSKLLTGWEAALKIERKRKERKERVLEHKRLLDLQSQRSAGITCKQGGHTRVSMDNFIGLKSHVSFDSRSSRHHWQGGREPQHQFNQPRPCCLLTHLPTGQRNGSSSSGSGGKPLVSQEPQLARFPHTRRYRMYAPLTLRRLCV